MTNPQPLSEFSPSSEEERAQPLSPAEFETPQDKDRLWSKETAARARAIAEGLRGLGKVDDADLRGRISAEFDVQLRGLVKHVLDGLVARDTSGALRRALENAGAALGQAPEEMPLIGDLVGITRAHIEELMKDKELDDADIAILTATLESVLGPQLDRLVEVDVQKTPPAAGADGESAQAEAA